MAAEILIVADQALPEPTLPDAAFAARHAHRASLLGVGNRLGKIDFDQPPAQRKALPLFERERSNAT
jgi:hypothetical protein